MLLRFLADSGTAGARIPAICSHLGIPRVSAHRLLKTLIDLAYVEQAEDHSYHLGFEAWSLGHAAAHRHISPAIAAAMKRISEATEESVFLMRRAGNEGICIASHDGIFPVRPLLMRVGARRHLGIGGSAVAVLAALPPAEAERIIEDNASAYVPFNITTDDVRGFIADARERGYAYSQGVVVSEIRTVSVPLPLSSSSSTTMAMSIVTLESRMLEPRRSEFVRLLQHEARLLCAPLAGATLG
jgi:DNA-binding IclR family transcriptional regulator